jgi:hypothetical protein
MIPGTPDNAVAANPPGGDLYFPAAAALASPGEGFTNSFGYAKSFGTTGHAGNLETAPLAFASPEVGPKGQAAPLASNAVKGHVGEVLNFRGSPVPWIGIAILLLFGILLISAELRLKAPGGRKLGGEVVL